MKHYNYIIGPTDTDSISFCKSDMSQFNPEEIEKLVNEINDISPEFMDWDNDGYYPACIALKAKNYVLWDGQKKIIKGSAFKTSSKEVALKDMMEEIVDAMIFEKENELVNIYHKYIKEAMNVQDISRWTQKKTITRAILDCESPTEKTRKNESKVWDAIKDEEDKQEGNKIMLYPCIISLQIQETQLKNGKTKRKEIKEVGLKLDKHWKNDHDSEKLIERVYDTICIFESILDMSQFINYGLVKNKELLKLIK